MASTSCPSLACRTRRRDAHLPLRFRVARGSEVEDSGLSLGYRESGDCEGDSGVEAAGT